MGAFRDFFESIWKNYVGNKLDAITDKFKTEIGDKITFVTTGINDIKTFLDTKVGTPITNAVDVVSGKVDTVKEGIDKIPTSLNELKTSIIELKEKIPKPICTFIEIQTWFNPLLAPLKALDVIKDILQGKKPDAVSWVGDKVGDGVKRGVKLVTDAALKNLTPVFEDFMEEQHIPEADREKIRKIAGSGEFGLNAVVGFMLGHFLSPVLSTGLAPAWETMAQGVWKTAPVRLEDPATLIRLKYKGLIDDTYFVSQMEKQGFGSTAQTSMINDYIWLPTVGDVIRWSVREAFYEDYAKTYGLDMEYPDKLNEYGAKLGISNEELKYFWRSHWELPSVRMGYEMLHRNVITDADLDKLFMAADIMPFWRDKLKAISYSPYTRVDTRRLFRDGVIGREEVKENYLAQGYDENHAEKLTAWTVKDTLAKQKDLTRTHIEKLYKEGQLTKEQAQSDLNELGYDEEESLLLLMLVDIKLEDEVNEDLITTWIDKFKIHLIDMKTLEANLDTLNLTVERTNRILAKAERIESKFVTLPSKDDLASWLSLGIISESIFKVKMQGLGYIDTDIMYYISEIKGGEIKE